MDILSYILASNKIENCITGNVSVTKNANGDLTFKAMEGTADETTVTYTKDELAGVGIQSITKNADGNTIVTLTNGVTQDIGSWNGKNCTVELANNSANFYKLKFTFTDNTGVEHELITPNLRSTDNISVAENTDGVFKIKKTYTDINGNTQTGWTSPNLCGDSAKIELSDTNDINSFKLDITNTVNGVKTKTTTDNLMGTMWFTGVELAGEEDQVKIIANTKVGDIYLNTTTGKTYKRTDKDNVVNTWEYVSVLKGEKGDDEVSIWLALPRNHGKTIEDYYNEKQVVGMEIRDVKPKITDENTKINTQYLYNTDPRVEFKVERLDYPTGNYCFRLIGDKTSGLFKCTSTTNINQTDPAFNDLEFIYVLNKITKKLELFTEDREGIRTTLGSLDVEFTPTIPDGYTTVTITDFNIIGTWKSVAWRGSEENYICIERNEEEVQVDLTNYYSKPEIDGIIGTKNINSKFNSGTVKEQLEEVTDLVRSSKEASLSTKSKNIVGAINEVYSKLVTDISEKANNSDLTTHTSDTNIHVTKTKTDLWDKVIDKVDKTSIITAKNNSATDEEVYSAKTVNTELDKINADLGEKANKSYVDDKLGTVSTVETIDDWTVIKYPNGIAECIFVKDEQKTLNQWRYDTLLPLYTAYCEYSHRLPITFKENPHATVQGAIDNGFGVCCYVSASSSTVLFAIASNIPYDTNTHTIHLMIRVIGKWKSIDS